MAVGLGSLLGRAGLGLLKTGAKAGYRGGSKLFGGLGSVIGPRASRIIKGAKASGTRGRPSLDPLQRAGRSAGDVGRALPGVGKEAVEATTKGLQSLWATIAAKAPNKVEALKQFRIAAAKQFPNSANLVNSSIAFIKNTGGTVANAPWAKWGASAVEQAGKVATGAANVAGRAQGAAPRILAVNPAERQAMQTVRGKIGEQASRIGSAIRDRAPVLSGGIVSLAKGAKNIGTAGVQKVKTGAQNIGSKLPNFDRRRLGPRPPSTTTTGAVPPISPAPVNQGIAGAGVPNPFVVPRGGPIGAGYDDIGRATTGARGGFAGYMDDAAAQGIPGAGVGGVGGAGAGAGGAGIWSDGTLRGVDRLLRRGMVAPFALAGKALQYPGILGATGLGIGAYYGLRPEPTTADRMRKGISSLAGNEKRLGRSLQDLGTLYAAGQVGGALGARNAEGLSNQLMGNYIGQELFGEEGFPNIPSRGGLNYVGGTPEGIFQNPAQDAIKARFGNEMMDDEEILKRYSEVLDKVRKQKTLSADDINFMMMFEALNKPTNLPTDRFESNAGLLNAMARNDVQNQFGGRFEVIDPNALYPTYQQPRVPINAASGGEASGPGTGTSDSIPARLSDGEFVMTAKAVRGAGDGDRKEGVRKMYELMNSLEAR
tara:strand:+ start:824 stop:2785 length:1962 start_codon:yes stop_codon:yes gene_type:complete